MKRSLLLLFLCLSLTLCLGSEAAMRCRTKIINIGDYKLDVLRKCGPPAYQERRQGLGGQVLRHPGRTLDIYRYQQIVIDEWVYNFGPRRLQQQLLFQDNILVEMHDLGYGY